MLRNLLSGLLMLAFAAEASAQTTPPGPPPMRHTTQQTTHRTTSKPGRTTVRKTSTKKVGLGAPAKRTGAVVTRRKNTAAVAPDPASGKGQGVYAAPGKPVNIQSGATMGYDGSARRRAKTNTTITPTPR